MLANGLVLALLVSLAQASTKDQCGVRIPANVLSNATGCSGLESVPIDDQYRYDPDGHYCWVKNRSGSFQYNFSTHPSGAGISLPDPSIVKIEDFYYVTGTALTQIPIYRSRDLVNWEFHRNAFDPLTRDTVSIGLGVSRRVCQLWAPHLYVDPHHPSEVLISFTGLEDRGKGHCERSDRESWTSIMLVSMPKDEFTRKGSPYFFADTRLGRGHQPIWYGYRGSAGAGSPFMLDGGWSIGKPVPVTGHPDLIGQNPGQVEMFGARPCHRGIGCNSWLGLDSFLFFDPRHSNARWMLYTWSDGKSPGWLGNHIAAHKMDSIHLMSASGTERAHLPLAYRAHQQNRPHPETLNGCRASDRDTPACIAEGPSAFFYRGRYYFTLSRNTWGSPAYGMFYRVANQFQDLALRSWGDDQTPEHVLVVSSDRTRPRGIGYGHGEIFLGPEDRPYLVVHEKADQSTRRVPFFKELTFYSDGRIVPLTNREGAHPRSRVDCFRVPRHLY